MTQNIGVHLYHESAFVPDKQSVGAVGSGLKNPTLVSAHFPSLESFFRSYAQPTVIAMTSLEALVDVIAWALILPHNHHLTYLCNHTFPLLLYHLPSISIVASY